MVRIMKVFIKFLIFTPLLFLTSYGVSEIELERDSTRESDLIIDLDKERESPRERFAREDREFLQRQEEAAQRERELKNSNHYPIQVVELEKGPDPAPFIGTELYDKWVEEGILDLEQADALEVARSNTVQLERCYSMVRRSRPSVEGLVRVKWVVQDDRVISAEVISNETGNKNLAQCLVKKVQKWRFPINLLDNNGERAQVVVPFLFVLDH